MGRDIIRPLYKSHEPFQEVPEGTGFRGVLMYNETEDKIQCHTCGKWFHALGGHLKSHKTTADDHRMKYGLNFNIALCGTEVAAMRRQLISRNFIEHKSSRPRPKKGKRVFQRQAGTKTVAQQNKFGLCELQMKTRYFVVKGIVGHSPTQEEIRKFDSALYSAIERRHGNINTFREVIKEKTMTIADHHTMPDVRLIAALRKKAQILGRAPKIRDFLKATDEFPYYGTILNRFGGWVTALRIAGLGEQEGVL
jgi:hypothetical protein